MSPIKHDGNLFVDNIHNINNIVVNLEVKVKLKCYIIIIIKKKVLFYAAHNPRDSSAFWRAADTAGMI